MKPMLAARPSGVADLRFPMFGSFKYDGIRALVHNSSLCSRRLTPIRNEFLRKRFSGLLQLDGELYLPPDFGDFHMGSGS
jgi:hypothetical protein